MNGIQPGVLLAQVVDLVEAAVKIALLAGLACAVAGKLGLAAPYLPKIDPTAWATLCGGFWLYRGGRVS
jgi:hypothetical protein